MSLKYLVVNVKFLYIDIRQASLFIVIFFSIINKFISNVHNYNIVFACSNPYNNCNKKYTAIRTKLLIHKSVLKPF